MTEYIRYFDRLESSVKSQNLDPKNARDLAHLILYRLLVLKFLNTLSFFHQEDIFAQLLKHFHARKTKVNFYAHYLTPLFSELSQSSHSQSIATFFSENINKYLDTFSQLGISIFKSKSYESLKYTLPNNLILPIIENLLGRYEYSVKERIFEKKKNHISPAVLGELFESNLLESEREGAGIYFTPPIEVDLMNRYALYTYFIEKCKNHPNLQPAEAEEKLINLFFPSLEEKNSILPPPFIRIIKKYLDSISILDPSCGSGDFLIGMYRLLIETYRKLGVSIDVSLLSSILNNNLYGLDIQKANISISQIRFYLLFLSELDAFHHSKDNPQLKFLNLNLKHGNGLTQSFKNHFPALMSNLKGFNIVIGNPPYIRQEKLYYQDEFNRDLARSKNYLKRSRDKYKKYLQSYVSSHFGIETGKTCDILVYFYFKAFEILKPGGVFAFLTSNTWLDSNFGKPLQEGLLRFVQLKHVINNHKEKSFEEANINTIITVGIKKEISHLLNGTIHFTNIFVPYEEIYARKLFNSVLSSKEENFQKLEYSESNIFFKEVETYRHIMVAEKDLWKMAGGTFKNNEVSEGSSSSAFSFPLAQNGYHLFKWSKFLRGPLIYFQIFSMITSKFSPIGEKFKRGYTTGANAFFYLPIPGRDVSHQYFRTKMDNDTGDLLIFFKNEQLINRFQAFQHTKYDFAFRIERKYWMRECDPQYLNEFSKVYRDPKSSKYFIPNYLVKSSKELDHVIVRPSHLNLIVLHINAPKSKLTSGILRYISWGESLKFHERPTCKSRQRWYDLSVKIRKPILCIIDVHERYVFSYNKYRFDIDARLYGLDFGDDYLNHLNFLFLKSNFYPLLMELEGRLGLGDGALDLKLCDYENLILPTEEILTNISSKRIERLFAKITESTIENYSIFESLNAHAPDEVRIEKLSPLMREIDDIIFEDILHISKSRRLRVYRALLQLVSDRIQKSKT